MTVRYYNPRSWAQTGLSLEQLEYLRGVDEDLDKAGSYFKINPVLFNYDGTDYQPQRVETALYTYNVAGTYQYQNGSASADSNREFPWVDSSIEFYRNNQLKRTFVFRHLCNYGIESAGPGRIGAKVRSYWRSQTGTEREGNFSVTIAGDSATVWDGTLYSSTHDVVTSYGGDASDYLITVTHIPTSVVGVMSVSLGAIAAVAPFYTSGGGAYK